MRQLLIERGTLHHVQSPRANLMPGSDGQGHWHSHTVCIHAFFDELHNCMVVMLPY